MAPISETSLFRITNLVGLIRGERRRLKRIRDLQSQYRADLLEYEEERDDGYRLAVFMQTRLLENAAMPVSTSPVWACLSAYLHSVARTTPKPLCCLSVRRRTHGTPDPTESEPRVRTSLH